jgi:hypothetical protein
MEITIESTSVHRYLDSLQAAINRMAINSTSSKTWCITLVSAVIVFASDKTKPDSVWMALIPISLFFLLDAYYLGLERRYRDLYNDFARKLLSGKVMPQDMFVLTPNTKEKLFISVVKAMFSISVLPFYVLITIMLIILRSWIF